MRRLSLLALVLLGQWACGLIPTGHDLTPGPSDGTAPFLEPEQVELCAAGARVSLESAGVAALCVPDGMEAKACATDAECSSIERCTCGRCAVRPCTTSATCEVGEQCRASRCTKGCGTDGDCGGGELCVGGGCAKTCSSDGECSFGERCDDLDHACASRNCTVQSCGSGETCTTLVRGADVGEPFSVGSDVFVELRDAAGSRIVHGVIDAPTRWTLDLEAPLSAPFARTGGPSLVDAPSGERWLLAWAREPTDVALPEAALLRFRAPAGTFDFGEPEVVLTPEAPFEGDRIGPPSAFLFGGEVHVAYEAGTPPAIGLAVLGEGSVDRLLDALPFVTTASIDDPLFWHDVDRVESPSVIVDPDGEGERARFYFSGHGVEGASAWVDGALVPADSNDSIGLVATRDLVAFSRFPIGPVLARRTNLRAYLGEREPSLRRLEDGRTEILFVGTSPEGTPVAIFRALAK